MGTEFKNIVDGLTGVMLWLEIQEGKTRMALKEHQRLGSTAACVMRGVQSCEKLPRFPIAHNEEEEVGKRLFFGDSWFGSVKAIAACAKAGYHACMMIKTGHSRSPKAWLEDKMKNYPGGTWITLEATPTKENVPLICIGYKYNKKKVLTFVMTKGAGKTSDGEPYEARFPDKYGNVCVRLVCRPEILSSYFKYSNCVDMHNQARQFDLALEKKWVTQDAYFRLYTTMIGMTVTDTWKILKKRNSSHSSITEFADILAFEMLEHAQVLQNEMQETAVSITNEESSATTISTITANISSQNQSHTKHFLTDKKQVRYIWCSRVNLIQRKMTMKCMECGKGFCRDSAGFGCWSHHVAFGGVPCAPKKGTPKRLVADSREDG